MAERWRKRKEERLRKRKEERKKDRESEWKKDGKMVKEDEHGRKRTNY